MLAMTLLVRDERQIIDSFLKFHLPKVDLLIVTDNGSVDGTLERLKEWQAEHEGKIVIVEQPKHNFQQSSWVTTMAQLAVERGADWLVHSDVDEFWMGDLRKEIEGQEQAGIAIIDVRSYFMRPTFQDATTEPDPALRMVWREEMWRRDFSKVIHRVHGFQRVLQGNHNVQLSQVTNRKRAEAATCHILHYYEQSWTHFKQKYVRGGLAYKETRNITGMGQHWVEKHDMYEQFGEDALFSDFLKNSYVSNEAALVQAGLVRDTSVFDVLTEGKGEPLIEEPDIQTPEELYQERLDALEERFRAEVDALKSEAMKGLESHRRRLNMTDRWKDTQAGRLGHVLQEVQTLRKTSEHLDKSVDERCKVVGDELTAHCDKVADRMEKRDEALRMVQEAQAKKLGELAKEGKDAREQLRTSLSELDKKHETTSTRLWQLVNTDFPRLSKLVQSIVDMLKEHESMGFFRRLFSGRPASRRTDE